MRILVPSAGAASSISVIKAAKERGHFVLATDMRSEAAGLFLADVSFTCPVCYEGSYIPLLIQRCRRYGVEFVIPINDAELPVFVQNRNEFEKNDIHLLMNMDHCVLNGHDKDKSWRICSRNKIRQPIRYFGNSLENQIADLDSVMPPPRCFPLIAKPPIGVGGRGQVIVNDIDDVKRLIASSDTTKLSQYLWQEYIYGVEYTVDCWGEPINGPFVAVPRTRGRVINGQATGGCTQYNPRVVAFVKDICKAFDSNNVCCVQVIEQAETGTLYFIEFNPRYGTGVSLSFEAGIDFLDLQFRQAYCQEITPEMLTYKAGVCMTRYWEEHFYHNEKELRSCPPPGIILPSGPAWV